MPNRRGWNERPEVSWMPEKAQKQQYFTGVAIVSKGQV
jgi:hypothetical protein